MALTSAQNTTLKAYIEADGTLNAFPLNSDGAFNIAKLLNLEESPVFTVWRTNVPNGEVGDGFDAGEVGNLTTANTSRLSAFADYSPDGVNPSLPDRRAFFDDVFSVGGVTEAKLLIVWKRLSTRGEAVFATGTGSDAVPALLDFEGNLSLSDVETARNS